MGGREIEDEEVICCLVINQGSHSESTHFISNRFTVETVSVFEFLCWIDFLNSMLFLNQFKWLNYKKTYSMIQTDLQFQLNIFYRITLNNGTFQIIKFSNFKSHSFFKFQIDPENKTEFFIYVKLKFYMCQIDPFI